MEKHYFYRLLNIATVPQLYDIVAENGLDKFAAFAHRGYGMFKEFLRNTPADYTYIEEVENSLDFFKALKQLANDLQEDQEDGAYLYINKPGAAAVNMQAWVKFFETVGDPEKIVELELQEIRDCCIRYLKPECSLQIKEILEWAQDFAVRLNCFDLDKIREDRQVMRQQHSA